MMRDFLCVIDENDAEVPGSRRHVDFAADPDGYRRIHAELQQLAGEGCWIYDSTLDRHSPTLLGTIVAAMLIGSFWLGIGTFTAELLSS